MGVAAIFGCLPDRYFWFPKMFGRMMNETWGRIHFVITLIGTYCIFMPMHYLGMAGQPRRYSQFTEVAYLHRLMPLNTFITYAAIVTIATQFIFAAGNSDYGFDCGQANCGAAAELQGLRHPAV